MRRAILRGVGIGVTVREYSRVRIWSGRAWWVCGECCVGILRFAQDDSGCAVGVTGAC